MIINIGYGVWIKSSFIKTMSFLEFATFSTITILETILYSYISWVTWFISEYLCYFIDSMIQSFESLAN